MIHSTIDLDVAILPHVVTNDLFPFTPHEYLSRCKFSTFTTCQPKMVEFYVQLLSASYPRIKIVFLTRIAFTTLFFMFLSLCRLCVCVFLCSHWSLVDVLLIFFCPADHVPDWQPRVLLGMVESLSVNVKKTTTTLPSGNPFKCHEEVLYFQLLIPPKRFDIFSP